MVFVRVAGSEPRSIGKYQIMKCNLVKTCEHTTYPRTFDWRIRPTFACTVLLIALTACALSELAQGEELHTESPAAFGFDWTEGWHDRPVHCHFSPRGTPMVHSFRAEPAFMRRDFLLDYSTRSETGRSEQEIGTEVEWPISRRLGLISVILEADLAVGVSGAEDGDWFAEGIVGVLVGLWDNADMRVGYQFPLSRSQDLNNGVTGGLLWHFK